MRSTERQQDPQTQRRSCTPWFVLLLVMIVAASAAAYVVYGQWREATGSATVDRTQVNPALGSAKRLQLEYFLGTHAAELEEPAGTATSPVEFVINPGEGASAIAANLAGAGIVRNQELFLSYLEYYGYDGALVAGSHTVDPRATIPELAVALSGGGPRNLQLNFLPGWRAEEMANYLSVTKPAQIDPQAFMDIIERRRPIDLSSYALLGGLPADASLEGYLFPTTYPITTETTSDELIGLMLAELDRQITPDLRQLIGAQGLTVREALILASIVEREAILPEEKPVVASVFLNRLRAGMPLQADPTVQYALGYQTDTQNWWKSPLALVDLEIDSPYNTYRIDGLPPGPIANPSRASLEAVASPATTDYLFFVLDCTAQQPGTHLFSVSFEEHLANVERCR